MSDQASSRRKFLQVLGMSAGASLLGTSALAAFVHHEDILRLNPEQQAFMNRYGAWMDAFIVVIRTRKENPGNMENEKNMMVLSEQAEKMQPELTEFLKNKDFALIYKASIERMSKEI